MSLTPNGIPESQTTTKIQVGPDVWIRPNIGQSVPEDGKEYSVVWNDGDVSNRKWHRNVVDYAFLNSGNFFPDTKAAEQAIIKPVDPTPITYKQWVDAGRQCPFVINGYGEVCNWMIGHATPPIVFSANKCWLNAEAAEAWRDQWERENGEVK